MTPRHEPAALASFLPLLACFAAFTWAVKRHFRQTGRMPAGMKVTSLLSLAGFLWFTWRVWSGAPSTAWPACLVLAALSLIVFFWAVGASRATPPTLAYDDDRPVFLMQRGPYRFVRHPFYLAYALFWIATAVATASPWGWLAPAVMVALYAHAAIGEERKFAQSDLAASYAGYRRQAGMFLPRPRTLLAGGARRLP